MSESDQLTESSIRLGIELSEGIEVCFLTGFLGMEVWMEDFLARGSAGRGLLRFILEMMTVDEDMSQPFDASSTSHGSGSIAVIYAPLYEDA